MRHIEKTGIRRGMRASVRLPARHSPPGSVCNRFRPAGGDHGPAGPVRPMEHERRLQPLGSAWLVARGTPDLRNSLSRMRPSHWGPTRTVAARVRRLPNAARLLEERHLSGYWNGTSPPVERGCRLPEARHPAGSRLAQVERTRKAPPAVEHIPAVRDEMREAERTP